MSEEDLRRARRDLEAARLLTEGTFHAQAISRAYYAVFRAAESALWSLGESRSKHSGIISAFGQRVVKEEGLAEENSSILHALFKQRNQADYMGAEASEAEAAQAIEEIERFVDAVADWLERRKSGQNGG